MTGFLALLSRDLRLVWRRPGDIAVVLAFFVVATVLFPLGIGPQANILARIAAGVLWCTALFASMLSLDRLFAADHEDGSLDLLLLAPWPLELAALAKCAAHWIVTGLPLAVLAPLLGVTFGLPPEALLAPAMAELRSILSGPTIQARCLECPPVAAAPVLRSEDRNWLARLLSWA